MNAAHIVVGLGWGDEGKGGIVDFLTRQQHAKLVVRFNGGPQAAHAVVLPDGRSHSFHLWGSGTFAGARTHLSDQVLIDPFLMRREAAELVALGIDHPWGRISVDPRCRVITPYQQIMNRLREVARGTGRYGTCGLGIGETVQDAKAGAVLMACELLRPEIVSDRLHMFRRLKIKQAEAWRGLQGTEELFTLLDDERLIPVYLSHYKTLATLFRFYVTNAVVGETDGTVVFEGAQGVLLDETAGFAPHYTWSTTTAHNAHVICAEDDVNDVTVTGVLRAYATRHGVGPFPTEDRTMPMRGRHDSANEWQGEFRVGAFDVPLSAYALKACPVDGLALTHLDAVTSRWPVAISYLPKHKRVSMRYAIRRATPVLVHVPNADIFVSVVSTALKTPVTIRSTGTTYQDKRSVRDAVVATI